MESDPFLLQNNGPKTRRLWHAYGRSGQLSQCWRQFWRHLCAVMPFSTSKVTFVSFCLCCNFSPDCNADNAMRNIFNGMMTSTSPATFSTATRTGIVGGSMSYRTTNVNTNLVSMSFPKASVGCNGIDVFLGPSAWSTGTSLCRWPVVLPVVRLSMLLTLLFQLFVLTVLQRLMTSKQTASAK